MTSADTTFTNDMETVCVCICGQQQRPNTNYCPRCGREIKQICPVCFEERRLLSVYTPYASPWCERRGELLLACRRCGRWLPSGVATCPDPACHGAVTETWPANTGRAPDGSGRTDGWRWPSQWDRQNPAYRAPVSTEWSADSSVNAAFVAHGRLYVWVGASLIAPGVGPAGTPAVQSTAAAPWKCWLGFEGNPAPTVSIDSRVALFGGGAILATTVDFVIGGLFPGRADQALRLNTGVPISQAASSGWWAGWATNGGRPVLYSAAVNAQWRNTECRAPGAPQIAAPRSGAKMLMLHGVAYWIAENGAAWSLICDTGICSQLTDPSTEARLGWCTASDTREGVHVLRVSGDGIRVGLDPVTAGSVAREAPGGTGALRDVLAVQGLITVVGEEIVTLDSRTGYSLGGGKYTGQWVTGALAEPEPDALDREPRLLMLTRDNEDGNLSALRPSSGGEEAVWRGKGIKPTGLIVAGRRMYVVHETGVTSIRHAPAGLTGDEQL